MSGLFLGELVAESGGEEMFATTEAGDTSEVASTEAASENAGYLGSDVSTTASASDSVPLPDLLVNIGDELANLDDLTGMEEGQTNAFGMEEGPANAFGMEEGPANAFGMEEGPAMPKSEESTD